MNTIQENALEKLIQKQEKSRTDIAKILVRDFPIEKDMADLIAFDATNQAIGIKEIKSYNKRLVVKSFLKGLKIAGQYTFVFLFYAIPISIILTILFFIGSCIYSVGNRPEFPRTYNPIPEVVRFENRDRKFNEDLRKGINSEEFLCVDWRAAYTDRDGTPIGSSCIHPNRLASLNSAMDEAVTQGKEGVIWNEPNGMGEVWSVERNNYRFIITATEDPNFKGERK